MWDGIPQKYINMLMPMGLVGSDPCVPVGTCDPSLTLLYAPVECSNLTGDPEALLALSEPLSKPAVLRTPCTPEQIRRVPKLTAP